MIQHAFFPSNNPRLAGRCACGHPEGEHPGPAVRRRSIESEREITREAARGVVDPEPLIAFSEVRSGGILSGEYVRDPLLVQLGRDRLRDFKEELSDARNHAVWLIQEQAGQERAHSVFQALRHVLLAYDLLCRDA